MDLATRSTTPLTTGISWDVESFRLNRDGSWLAFTVNEAGPSRLYLMNVRTRAYRVVNSVPAGVIGSLAWHHNGRDLAFSMSSAQSPADVYSLNAVTGGVTRWTASELGGIVASALVTPRVIRWRSFDEREITGLLYQPPAQFSGKRPVIIDIHGGPEGQSRPVFQARRNYYLNEQGVAVILPNVRGSTGYGKTFLKLDNGMRREDSVKDIGALLDRIATQPDLDAAKVMVTGGSYGGYMTLAVATQYDDRICCSLDVVGISHLGTFLKNTESYRRDLRRVEYGDERIPEMAAYFDRTAPLHNAGKIRKPLFVVQGANDPRVPRTESEQMVTRVRQNGGPVWFLMATTARLCRSRAAPVPASSTQAADCQLPAADSELYVSSSPQPRVPHTKEKRSRLTYHMPHAIDADEAVRQAARAVTGSDAVIATDDTGTILYWNSAAEEPVPRRSLGHTQ